VAAGDALPVAKTSNTRLATRHFRAHRFCREREREGAERESVAGTTGGSGGLGGVLSEQREKEKGREVTGSKAKKGSKLRERDS
jgi:hypothetical protein